MINKNKNEVLLEKSKINKTPNYTYALSPSLNSFSTTSYVVLILSVGSTSSAKHFKSRSMYSFSNLILYCFSSNKMAREETSAEARAFKSVLPEANSTVAFSDTLGCKSSTKTFENKEIYIQFM